VKEHLLPKGRYLLDVASGPIQYEEYLSYSQNYQYRICADISLQGLKKAQEKLKDKGLYVLCDMTCLPFNANAVDYVEESSGSKRYLIIQDKNHKASLMVDLDHF